MATALSLQDTIPLIKADLPNLDEISDEIAAVLSSGRVSNFGPALQQFEQAAANRLGTKAIAVSSGTMGLLFTLQALDVRPGSAVVLPSFTFVATAQATRFAGATPVFADVNDRLTLSVDDLRAVLDQRDDVDAVVPVHVFGLPCDVHEIQSVVDDYALRVGRHVPVIYDSAHAFGSKIGNQPVGTFGDAEVFSLSITKLLVGVEGGLITTHSDRLIESIRCMRNYGIENNYNATLPGLNGKMSELHAIIANHNLPHVEQRVNRRQEIARRFRDRIQNETVFRNLPLPDGVTHTFKDFSVLVPESMADRRDDAMELLRELGVETRAYFSPPVHRQTHFAQFADRPLPRTDYFANRVITLPFFTSMTDDHIDRVIMALQTVANTLSC
jgi:dTDP-4-amino-4,6-dideoxygalactose transaminase